MVHTVVLQYIYFLKSINVCFIVLDLIPKKLYPRLSKLPVLTSQQMKMKLTSKLVGATLRPQPGPQHLWQMSADRQELPVTYPHGLQKSGNLLKLWTRSRSSYLNDGTSSPRCSNNPNQKEQLLSLVRPKRATALFGEEVAESLEHITDDHTRAVAKQEIRSIFSNYRLRSNPRSSAENVSQIGSQTFMNLNYN